MNKTKALPLLFGFSAVLLWSTVATAFKIALRSWHFGWLVFGASLVSTLILGVLIVLQKKTLLFLSQKKSDWWNSILCGFLNPFLYYLVLLKAYSVLPAQQAMTLNYVWPLVLSVLAIPFLKQKLYPKAFIALLISFSGIVCISSGGNIAHFHFTNTLGISLALGSSLIWAIYWLLNMKSQRDVTVKLFTNFITGTLFSAMALWFFPFPQMVSINSILSVSYVGFFEMGITFFLWLKALQLSSRAASISQLIFISPFLSLFWIQLVVGEKILFTTWIGLILIISGILLQQFKSLPQKNG